MNQFLVANLNRLNKLLALLLILAGVIGGQAAAANSDVLGQLNIGPLLGALLGLLGGLGAASLTCGFVAILIEILDALGRMETQLSRLYAVADGLDDDLRQGRLGSPSGSGATADSP